MSDDEAAKIRKMLDVYGDDPFNVDKLHPDLQPWVFRHEVIGVCLKSPFVVSVPFFSWAMANEKHEHQKRLFDQHVASGRFDKALWFLERPFRMTYVLDWHEDGVLRGGMLREVLCDAWTDCEFPYQFGIDRLLDLFRDVGFVHDYDDDPRLGMEPNITIYRGQVRGMEPGISWTTDMERAAFFARRFGADDGVILVGHVNTSEILAMFKGRSESEIVCDPDMVAIDNREEAGQ